MVEDPYTEAFFRVKGRYPTKSERAAVKSAAFAVAYGYRADTRSLVDQVTDLLTAFPQLIAENSNDPR